MENREMKANGNRFQKQWIRRERGETNLTLHRLFYPQRNVTKKNMYLLEIK